MSLYGVTQSKIVLSYSDELVSADPARRDRQMRILPKARKVVMGLVQEREIRGLVLKTGELDSWSTSHYWCRTVGILLNPRTCQGLRRCVVLIQPCVAYMVTGEDTISGELAEKPSVRKTKIIRSRLLENLGKNTRSFEDENKVPQEEEENCGRELFRKLSLSIL